MTERGSMKYTMTHREKEPWDIVGVQYPLESRVASKNFMYSKPF